MTGSNVERRRAIEAALIDFHRAPGRHTIALREPALLFASVREVLQYAGERNPDDQAPPPALAVVDAARFFVRTALLQPDADHYALLGLPQAADSAAVRERYRAMMRLVHPDFAAGPTSAAWPVDAATRINQAYEVLSSPERRRAYDETIAAPAPRPARDDDAAPRPTGRTPTTGRFDRRRILRQLATGFGALAAIAVIGLWIATSSGERDWLVQRGTTRVAADHLPSLFWRTPDVGPAASPSSSPGDESLQAAVARALPAVLAVPTTAASAPLPIQGEPIAAPAPRPATASVVAQAPSAPASTSPAPRPAASGPSMSEVHPLLMRLLQEIESGWGDNLIANLDFSTRRAPAAQALARQLDSLCDGARPVRIAKVELRGEPRGGRLIVVGQVQLQVRDDSTRQFRLQAEFIERDGAPVLTGLSPVSDP